MRRVVVTGFGIVSCLGNDVRDVADALRHGRSGIGFVEDWKALGFRSALAGRIRNLNPPDIPKRNLRQMGLTSHFAVHAAHQAIADAKLESEQIKSDRTAIIIGCAGNFQDVYQQCHMFRDEKLKLGGTALQRVIADSTSANLPAA